MSGYKFIRKDRNKFGGRIAFYTNDQLSSWTIKIENPSDIEILTTEITKRKNKIGAAGIYKPTKLSVVDFDTRLETIMRDINMTTKSESVLGYFCTVSFKYRSSF